MKKCKKNLILWVGLIHYDPLWSNMIQGSDPYKVMIKDLGLVLNGLALSCAVLRRLRQGSFGPPVNINIPSSTATASTPLVSGSSLSLRDRTRGESNFPTIWRPYLFMLFNRCMHFATTALSFTLFTCLGFSRGHTIPAALNLAALVVGCIFDWVNLKCLKWEFNDTFLFHM